jgi:hypothetical protein
MEFNPNRPPEFNPERPAEAPKGASDPPVTPASDGQEPQARECPACHRVIRSPDDHARKCPNRD